MKGPNVVFEMPVLLPPDDLLIEQSDGGEPIALARCHLLGHNVAPDGKANPIDLDDVHFLYVYQHADDFFLVRGLNPEMMSGKQISPAEADRLVRAMPYRME